MSNKTETYRGITFAQGLFLLFLGLKLTGQIGWSWWWVFAPIIVAMVTAGIGAAVTE